jgi:hypothetical protein
VGPHCIECRFSKGSGKGILLGGMVRPKKVERHSRAPLEANVCAMTKLGARAGNPFAELCQMHEHLCPGEGAKGHHDAKMWQKKLEFRREIWRAGIALFGKGAVFGWCAVHGGGEPEIAKFEAITRSG